jgi:hypothetical protein
MHKAVENGMFAAQVTPQVTRSQSPLLPHHHGQAETAVALDSSRRGGRLPTHPSISAQQRGNTAAGVGGEERITSALGGSSSRFTTRGGEPGLPQVKPDGPSRLQPTSFISSSNNFNNNPPVSLPKPATSARADRFFIAIETKFRLEGPERPYNPTAIRDFLSRMAACHNHEVNAQYPRMEWRSGVEWWWKKERDFKKWIVMNDPLNNDIGKRSIC